MAPARGGAALCRVVWCGVLFESLRCAVHGTGVMLTAGSSKAPHMGIIRKEHFTHTLWCRRWQCVYLTRGTGIDSRTFPYLMLPLSRFGT